MYPKLYFQFNHLRKVHLQEKKGFFPLMNLKMIWSLKKVTNFSNFSNTVCKSACAVMYNFYCNRGTNFQWTGRQFSPHFLLKIDFFLKQNFPFAKFCPSLFRKSNFFPLLVNKSWRPCVRSSFSLSMLGLLIHLG